MEKCILNIYCCVLFCNTRRYANNPDALCACLLARTRSLKTRLTLPRNPACVTWRTNSIYMNKQTSQQEGSLLLRIAESSHPSLSGSLSSRTDHNMSAHRMVMPVLAGWYTHLCFSSLSSRNIKDWAKRWGVHQGVQSNRLQQQGWAQCREYVPERGRAKSQSSEEISL